MFRIVKLGIFGIITALSLILLGMLTQQLDKGNVPGSPTVIEVTNQNGKYSKKRVFDELKKSATQNNYQISLVRLNTVTGNTSKSFYNFNDKLNQNITYFKNSDISKINDQKLSLEEVKGRYYTNADSQSLKELSKKLSSLGLSFTIYHISLLSLLKNESSVISYLPIFISLLAILLIIMLIEKIYSFKKYAVLRLNGWSYLQIIVNDLKRMLVSFSTLIGIFLGLSIGYALLVMNKDGIIFWLNYSSLVLILIFVFFIVLDLISYTVLAYIHLYPALKGQTYTRPFVATGYIFKISLIILTTINVLSLHHTVETFRNDQTIMHEWIKHNSGYVLQFTNVDDKNVTETDKLGSLTRETMDLMPNNIVSRNSQEFHPNLQDDTPENGNVLFVNKNYFKYNEIKSTNNKKISFKDIKNKNFTILIPINRENQRQSFIKKFDEFINFQETLSGTKKMKGSLKIVTYANNQSIFNYTIGKEIADSISRDPIIVVINNLNALSDNFYYSAATQGMIQFFDLDKLQQTLNKTGLSKYIGGITDAKTRLANFRIELVQRITILSLIVIISLIQLILVIAFISLSFIQKNRSKLTINKLFGQSNINLVSRFILFNLSIDTILFLCVFIVQKASFSSLWYLIIYLIAEGLIIFFLSNRSEKKLLLTLNKGN